MDSQSKLKTVWGIENAPEFKTQVTQPERLFDPTYTLRVVRVLYQNYPNALSRTELDYSAMFNAPTLSTLALNLQALNSLLSSGAVTESSEERYRLSDEFYQFLKEES